MNEENNKRIIFFVGEIRAEYNYKLCRAFVEESRNRGYTVEIFQNFEMFGSNILFAYGEKNIAKIPDLTLYDAIAIASDTFSLSGYEEDLLSFFKNVPDNVPIVSLRKEMDGFYNVLIDDYSSIYNITKHCIKDHGYKNIAFMKGKPDLKDSRVRYRAFEDAMIQYGLPIKLEFVFNGNYWKNLGPQAVDHFLSGPEKPDVIICSNDYMGISVVEELLKRGYRVPEDIAVTGFDGVKESLITAVPLTTAKIDYTGIVKAFYKICENVWEGKEQNFTETVPSEIVFRDSCGCKHTDRKEIVNDLYEDYVMVNEVVLQSTFLYLNLENVKTMEDMFHNISINLECLNAKNRIYFCFNSPEEDNEDIPFTKTAVLRGIVSFNSVEYVNISFQRTDILPKDYRSEAMTVVNLHEKDVCFGYIVVEGQMERGLATFLENMVQGIVNWYSKTLITTQNEELKRDVEIDVLTQIPNRKRIDLAINQAHMNAVKNNVDFFICSIDMDNLKYINDTYGHQSGDIAIKAVAEIIYNTSKPIGIAARFGGDEFMVCYNTCNEEEVEANINEIQSNIQKYNAETKEPFSLSISIGYCKFQVGMVVSACIRKADELMYAEKRRKKKK